MVEVMRFDWNPLSLRKQNHVFVKLIISILVMGLAFHLFFYQSTYFPDPEQKPFMETTDSTSTSTETLISEETPKISLGAAPNSSVQAPEGFVEVPELGDQVAKQEKCDLFSGEWIPNPSGPKYTNESCRVISEHQNCMKNGRPDSGYFYWRWSPRDCDLPQFDGQKFLELMRNKWWAFIGDSIARNHVQSLVCILWTVEEAVEVYHDADYKSLRWSFPSYNFTLSVFWSPFLIKAETFEDVNGVSSSEVQLHLDEVHKVWTDQYRNFDYLVASSGKWFLKSTIYYENNTIVGCHYCPGKNLTDIAFDYAYRRALQLFFKFINTSEHKPVVLFRTGTPDHFENGSWDDGGTCKRQVPFKEGEASLNFIDSILRNVELEEFKKAAETASKTGTNLKLLDTTNLSLLRPDGHPGPYRQFHPFETDKNATVQYDCLHWCLPGPIDTWNDLVMEMAVNG